MDYFTPLWSGIVDSSLWDEPDPVVKVFVTMLALKDPDFIVRKTAYQIGRCARKTEKEVLDALKVLSAPDTKRLEAQPHEGRRVQKVPDGWLILNGRKYQEKMKEEFRRDRWRKAQAAKRDRDKRRGLTTEPQAGERAYFSAEQNEASQAQLDAIAEDSLPKKVWEGDPES
jgi:hypothetical protein